MTNETILKVKASDTRLLCCISGVVIGYIAGRALLYTEIYDSAFLGLVILSLGALVLTLYGSYKWATEKGRSGWWCLMGLLAPIGYIVLMKLKLGKGILNETQDSK